MTKRYNQKGLICATVTLHAVIHHLGLDLLQEALLLSEDLKGHRKHAHESEALNEPEGLSAIGSEDVEDLKGAVDHAVGRNVFVVLD